MNAATLIGGLFTLLGLAGYAVGIATPYTGRSFSITLFMIGITVIAIRGVFEERDPEP